LQQINPSADSQGEFPLSLASVKREVLEQIAQSNDVIDVGSKPFLAFLD